MTVPRSAFTRTTLAGLDGTSRDTISIAQRRPLNVLVVQDSAEEAWLVQRALERGGYRLQLVRVADEDALRGALLVGGWDVVIADYTLASMSGPEVVAQVRMHDADLPCLLVTNAISEEAAVDAMRLGANDYVFTHNLARLVPVVERELRQAVGRRERRRTEVALASAEERLRLILEQSPDAVASFGLDGRVFEWNARAAVLFGLSRGEVVGCHFGDIVLAPEWRATFSEALGERFLGQRLTFALRRTCEVTGHHRDGRLLPLGMTVIPVPSSSGLSFCVFIHDLTARHAADAARTSLELQLRQSQKMEAVGKLAGGIAHDFNNLLTVIQGQALLLEAGLLPADAQSAAVGAIVQAAEKAAELTRQLLTFSRRRVVRLAPVDLNGVVLDLGKLLRRLIGVDVELHTRLAPGLVGIEADTSMIEQVLMNLAVNARDAMPDGGSLVVSTSVVRADPPSSAQTNGCGPGPFARLSISDSGSGIDPDLLPHIFEPFFTTKDTTRSSGLGLATVFGIVEQHKGWIEVESQVGRGTTFHVYLPFLPHGAVPAPDDGLHTSLPRGHECVMVVEDELAVREMVRDLLQRQGYDVVEAASGREALEAWAAHGDRVALVLADVMMPGGMNGIQLVEQLRQRRPELRALLTSGCPSDGNTETVALEGVDHFIAKPYRPAVLIRMVRELIDADPTRR